MILHVGSMIPIIPVSDGRPTRSCINNEQVFYSSIKGNFFLKWEVKCSVTHAQQLRGQTWVCSGKDIKQANISVLE